MLRSVLALWLRASAPARDLRTPRVTSTIIDGRVSPEREAALIADGRKAVEDFRALLRGGVVA